MLKKERKTLFTTVKLGIGPNNSYFKAIGFSKVRTALPILTMSGAGADCLLVVPIHHTAQ